MREIDFTEFYDDLNRFEHNYEEGKAISEKQRFSPEFEHEPN
jgi:hypothetical protein